MAKISDAIIVRQIVICVLYCAAVRHPMCPVCSTSKQYAKYVQQANCKSHSDIAQDRSIVSDANCTRQHVPIHSMAFNNNWTE